ncbi:hypothetical protein BJX68DRAFT_166269 [Aspergillus pseudodeflectus]|uniref:C2H2-type domain-containing protein n=1 Tax=Aspergillus pseudodeflectus TaxID=176178 RepID=A0ABR4JRA9_9EURO
MGHWKEASAAPSVGSQATTIQLSNDHTFTFPSAPKKPLLQRLEDMKCRHLANLDQELDSLPNYDLYKQHNQHLPLEPEALEELIGSIKELTAKTSMMIDNDRISCEAGSMDVTCPYCCCIISSSTVMDRNKWVAHVKHDIDPYICLFEDCDAPDALYSRSHSWLEHMRRHRNHYRCSARSHGPLVFKNQSKYESHMTENHKLPKAQLRLLVERQSQSSRPVFESCPLCGIPEPTGRLESHIASHLVYLALKSLPAFDDDGDSEDPDGLSSYSNTTVPQTEDSAEGYDEPGQKLADHQVANGSDAANQLLTDVIRNEPIPIFSELPVPTLDGFTDQISQINPCLAPALVDRFAIEQVRRYTRLLSAQHMHANVAAQRTCGSESFCLAQGGRSIHLPLRIIDPGAETDDADIVDPSQLAGLTLDAGQFPPGIPLPPNVRRLPAKLDCQFCFKVKNVQKPSDWSKHIIEDLQPYTCSFPECQGHESFKRKADWVRHENERHRKLEWWECERVDCRHICYRKENYIQHLVREHRMPEPKMMEPGSNASNDVSGERERAELLEAVSRGHRETTKKPSEEPCRFCGNISTTWKKVTVHLAKHFEQIAMPVLGLVNPPSATSENSARLGDREGG